MHREAYSFSDGTIFNISCVFFCFLFCFVFYFFFFWIYCVHLCVLFLVRILVFGSGAGNLPILRSPKIKRLATGAGNFPGRQPLLEC